MTDKERGRMEHNREWLKTIPDHDVKEWLMRDIDCYTLNTEE